MKAVIVYESMYGNIARPESFLVIQAQEWGASLAARLATERVHRW